MKVRRAIYRGTDGSYIYSTTDMGINPYHESGFVMKFVDHCVEDEVKEADLFKPFTVNSIEETFKVIQVDSDVDKRILEMESIPFFLLVDKDNFYVDVNKIKEQREKEQNNLNIASEIAMKGFRE